MNKVILIGRLTRDPELRYTPSNMPVCSFAIAVNREYTGANGEREADFINCVAFQKSAENLCKFMKKGSQILVEGKIQVRKYTDQNNVNRLATDVVCDKINFLEAKKQEPQQQNYFNTQPTYNEPVFENTNNTFEINDEDLPF